MNVGKWMVAGLVSLVFGSGGCSSARSVEVSGKVTVASSVVVGDRLIVDFIDVVGDGSDAKQSVAYTAQLRAPGDFQETVPLEGDQVLVRAIDDRDGDGQCSAGEAWGQTHVPVLQNKAGGAMLLLTARACPSS